MTFRLFEAIGDFKMIRWRFLEEFIIMVTLDRYDFWFHVCSGVGTGGKRGRGGSCLRDEDLGEKRKGGGGQTL